jgi:hypothetical protein
MEALNEALRFLDKIDHWVSAKYATLAARKICDVLEKLPALAQSDAEPVRTAPETCPHCFNEEDCGQIELCSALAKGPQSDAQPKGIDLDDADRAYDKWAEHRNGQSRLDAFRAGVEFGLRHTALAQSDASAGLIEAAKIAERIANENDEVEWWVNRDVLRHFAKYLRTQATAAALSHSTQGTPIEHGEIMLAARQGNGG